MPELRARFGVADGEIVRLDAIEEALAAKDVAEQCEGFRVGFKSEDLAGAEARRGRRRRRCSRYLRRYRERRRSGRVRDCVARGPEGIFVVAACKEKKRRRKAR